MAAAKSVEKLEKELFCAVCMQVLTSPRHLSSCDHTFCDKCLKMVVSSGGEANSSLKCPMCRKTSTLPEKGVSGLKSNPLICRILEVLKTKMNSSQKGCDSCGDTESALKTYCRDCFQLICQSCTKSHERMKLKYRNHRTVLLSDIQNGKVKVSLVEDSEKRNKYKCEEHDGELRSYFCKTCKRRICRDCVALEHNKDGHDCTTLRQIFTEMQEKIGRLREMCLERKKEIEWDMNNVDKTEQAGAAKKFQEMRESAAAATFAAMSYLQEAEEQLLTKVGKLERAFKRNVQLSRDHVSGITDNIDRVISEVDSILATNEAPEFSALPDDLIKKMEELLAKEFKVAAVDDLLALKGTSIKSHYLSLTMSSYADVVLSGVWQVKAILNSKASCFRVFCNNSHVIVQTKGNVYKRPLVGDGSGWNDKLLSVQNNQSIAEVAVSFKDQVMYISFRNNVELGIRMVQLSEINGRNGCYSSFEDMKSVTPFYWSADTEMMTTDCTGRIIIVENQMGQIPPVFSTLPKSSPNKIQETVRSASANYTVHQASALPVQTSPASTCLTGSPTLNMVTPGSGLSPPVVRKKVLRAGKITSPSTTPAEQKTHFAEKGAFSFRSATVYRHKPNITGGFGRSYHDPQSDSVEVPFGVASVAAAKTGQLAFLREDKKAVIITDEDGRVQHEIKEPGRMYLSISCTESDSLYVLSTFWGSRIVTLTKHSLDDGGLLEYVIDRLDASDGVTNDKRQIMANYGNDRVILIIGKKIRIYSRKEWRVIDDYDNYMSDDSDL